MSFLSSLLRTQSFSNWCLDGNPAFNDTCSSLLLKKIGNIPVHNLVGLDFNRQYTINADLSLSSMGPVDEAMVTSLEGIFTLILVHI